MEKLPGRKWTAKDLGLEPARYEALDINCLDDLPIKNLELKKKTKKFKIGKLADDETQLEPRLINGMTKAHEQ